VLQFVGVGSGRVDAEALEQFFSGRVRSHRAQSGG
jgi:hypothetical protein